MKFKKIHNTYDKREKTATTKKRKFRPLEHKLSSGLARARSSMKKMPHANRTLVHDTKSQLTKRFKEGSKKSSVSRTHN